jgi:hypothetical protein
MSRMFGSHPELAQFGYIMPDSLVPGSTFTVSHMLYWFTHLTEIKPLLVETELAAGATTLATHIPAPPNTGQMQLGRPVTSSFSYPNVSSPQFYQYTLQPAPEGIFLDFKPWVKENHCPGRAWYATILPDRRPVIVKCWDSYNTDPGLRNNEVVVYMKIQSLWGRCVPELLASCEIDFCHAIILERIEVLAPITVFMTVGIATVGKYIDARCCEQD